MFHAIPDRAQWTKFKTGVVCLVKDNLKKSYYIRLLDLAVRGSMIFPSCVARRVVLLVFVQLAAIRYTLLLTDKILGLRARTVHPVYV